MQPAYFISRAGCLGGALVDNAPRNEKQGACVIEVFKTLSIRDQKNVYFVKGWLLIDID
jgi:hypothetical protein